MIWNLKYGWEGRGKSSWLWLRRKETVEFSELCHHASILLACTLRASAWTRWKGNQGWRILDMVSRDVGCSCKWVIVSGNYYDDHEWSLRCPCVFSWIFSFGLLVRVIQFKCSSSFLLLLDACGHLCSLLLEANPPKAGESIGATPVVAAWQILTSGKHSIDVTNRVNLYDCVVLCMWSQDLKFCFLFCERSYCHDINDCPGVGFAY